MRDVLIDSMYTHVFWLLLGQKHGKYWLCSLHCKCLKAFKNTKIINVEITCSL